MLTVYQKVLDKIIVNNIVEDASYPVSVSSSSKYNYLVCVFLRNDYGRYVPTCVKEERKLKYECFILTVLPGPDDEKSRSVLVKVA